MTLIKQRYFKDPTSKNITSGVSGGVKYSSSNAESTNIFSEISDSEFGKIVKITADLFLNNYTKYRLYLETPFDLILDETTSKIKEEYPNTLTLIISFKTIVIILFLILLKLGIKLDKEIRNKTDDLEKTNIQLMELTNKLKKSNEILKMNYKLQREFINVAAHELRTPIQAILGFSEMLDLIPERKDYLKFIIRNATRLEKLA